MRALLFVAALSITCVSCTRPSPPAGGEGPGAGARSPEAPATGAAPGSAAASLPGGDRDPSPRAAVPVVVELFSSEGCSSCPPADAVLRDLAAARHVEGAEVLALEMHVDYWDDLGWTDPFSSEAYTSRQRMYARSLGDRSMYTPQMVVDGRAGFVGSDAAAARREIAQAARAPKARVEAARAEGGGAIAITVSGMPEPAPASSVMVALVEEGLVTGVKRGENAGATLAHGPVVRSLSRAGAIAAGARGKAFEGTHPVTLAPGWRKERMRAVVFVQAEETRAILGGAATPMP